MGVVLIGEFQSGYGHSPRHLLNKCETDNKKRRESFTELHFRITLSFLLSVSDIALRAVILFGFASK